MPTDCEPWPGNTNASEDWGWATSGCFTDESGAHDTGDGEASSVPVRIVAGVRPSPRAYPARARMRAGGAGMIRKLATGEYRLYSRKTDPRTGKRRNLGTFRTRAAAEKHEREVQYFKRAK
jgi:hypothetical protein